MGSKELSRWGWGMHDYSFEGDTRPQWREERKGRRKGFTLGMRCFFAMDGSHGLEARATILGEKKAGAGRPCHLIHWFAIWHLSASLFGASALRSYDAPLSQMGILK